MNGNLVNLSAYTPAGLVYSGAGKSVLLPCASGDIEVLPGHARLLACMEFGIVVIHRDKSDYLLVDKGVISITDSVILSCDTILNLDCISVQELENMYKIAKDKGEDMAKDSASVYARAIAIKKNRS